MRPGREFRHNAAIGAVQIGLIIDHRCQDFGPRVTGLPDHGGGGVITAALQPQNGQCPSHQP